MLEVGKLYKTLERVSIVKTPGYREQIVGTGSWQIAQAGTVMMLLGWEPQSGDPRNVNVWLLHQEQIFLYLGALKDFENGALWERVL